MLIDTHLDTIDTLAQHDGGSGSGIYLLTGANEKIGASQQPYLELTLEDATGRATGYVWPEARPTVQCPALPSPVVVRATVKLHHESPQLKVQSLAALAPSEVAWATALLPRRRCPEVALHALARLTQLEHELPDALRSFLHHVLLDPQITLPFLTCRGSVDHHHAFQGGLLVHCTEMLDFAAAQARFVIPEDEWAPYLCQLAYLFHDLGKLRSVGDVRRPLYPFVEPHELLTIELLAPHLRWLELRNLRLASGLRHVFGYLAKSARDRRPPAYAIAEIVRDLDQLSAAGNNHRNLDHLLRRPWDAAASSAREVPARPADRRQPPLQHASTPRVAAQRGAPAC